MLLIYTILFLTIAAVFLGIMTAFGGGIGFVTGVFLMLVTVKLNW